MSIRVREVRWADARFSRSVCGGVRSRIVGECSSTVGGRLVRRRMPEIGAPTFILPRQELIAGEEIRRQGAAPTTAEHAGTGLTAAAS